MKKTIVFYTQIFYLDAALEYILLCSRYFNIEVLIEIAPESKKANIFNLDVNLSEYPFLTPYGNVATEWNIQYLDKYFVFICKRNVLHLFESKSLTSSVTNVDNNVRSSTCCMETFIFDRPFLRDY